jgi:uncharacterized damage-inducible protein DinB
MSTMTPAELRAQSRARSRRDFHGTIRSHYPYWDGQYRPYLLMALEALPREHFDYAPRPDMLTAHQTLVHIAEAERVWNDILNGRETVEWVVERTPPAQGFDTKIEAPDHAALRALLAECHRPIQALLDLPVEQLEKTITYRASDGIERTYTLHWILDHVQEHEIHHRAQLNLYLRMLGITPPSI